MTNQEAFKALRARVLSVRKEGVDAFGTSPSGNGWLAIVIPHQHIAEAENAAADLGLTLYDPIRSDLYGVHRLLNTQKDQIDRHPA